MKWSNLKQNKCPSCNKAFTSFSFQIKGIITCLCGFRIRESRYSEIVNSQVNQDIEEKYTDNDEEDARDYKVDGDY